MHTLETHTPHRFSPVSHIVGAKYEPNITFSEQQTTSELHVGKLVAQLTAERQVFYGVEVTAQQSGKPVAMDFNEFLPVLPAFLSIVWLGFDYWKVEPVEQVCSLQLARHMERRIPIMPHLSAFRLSEKRLDDILALNLTNLLAVRGDVVHEGQPYIYANQIVERARKVRGDSISICVAGYPEGYTNEGRALTDFAENIKQLKKKVDAGADFIITQFSFRPELIVQFIENCRNAGIEVPIVVGQVVPDSFKTYKILEKITGVRLPSNLREEVEKLADEPDKAAAFFVQLALNSIQHVFNAQLGVYGIQFFTLNRFGPVHTVLHELRALGLLKEKV